MSNKNVLTGKKAAIVAVVFNLLKANNTVTTLEVKTEVRKSYPDFYTTQKDVSDTMDHLATENVLTYTDNGTFRTYSDPRAVKVAPAAKAPRVKNTSSVNTAAPVANKLTVADIKSKRISRTQAADLMANNRGHFFTAVFTTKKNKLRTINGQYLKDQGDSKLGYIKVRELNKLKSKEQAIRNINLQTLEQLSIRGKHFIVG